MFVSYLFPALLLSGRIVGHTFWAPGFAKVTRATMLYPRQDDGIISTLGCATTKGLPEMCLGSYPAFTPSSSIPSSTASPSTSSAASATSVICNQRNDNPDQGIEQQGCICTSGSTTKTLPLLATYVNYDSSCAYSNLDTSTIAITQDFGPPTTNTMICQACTPTTDFGATCTSLPNCIPQTPSATIQIGSSPVQVGTLTSAALYTSISSAIASLCPPTATACDENSNVKIG